MRVNKVAELLKSRQPAHFEFVEFGGRDLHSLVQDPSDPAWKNDSAMLEHLAFMKRHYPEGAPTEPFNVLGRIAEVR
jgi:hypothetical protein